VSQVPAVGEAIRHADAATLGDALRESRRDTLATFALVEAALSGRGLAVPYDPTLNPPLWELGHIGWFQDYWIGRNSQRNRGTGADPQASRTAPLCDDADALYDSSRVPHPRRWQLPLPDAQRTRGDLAVVLDRTLAWLESCAADDRALYFHRLSLFHEDMHHEAALYMAQALGIAITDARWQPQALPEPVASMALPADRWHLGSGDAGFAFDNELGAHAVATAAYCIDAQVLRWAEFLPFVDAHGYDDARWWTPEGLAWRRGHGQDTPRYLQRHGSTWQQWRHGRWIHLDPALPACHLTQHEALAWCAWAGRRLPSEAEWERAASSACHSFNWGQVWEWTSSTFLPYPGFVPHPYVDYSAPWFGSRVVLRGASFGTQARLRHVRYRNFFAAQRNDIFAGFRTCAC
jgi:ergothioneine biosynthesis protein EgtB